jgi:class 3 adenylate cyclase
VAGNIGSPDRVKYGVVGPPVNLVSRIQGLTAGGEILASDAVVEKTRNLVAVGPPAQVAVKGAGQPVTVYRILGLLGS